MSGWRLTIAVKLVNLFIYLLRYTILPIECLLPGGLCAASDYWSFGVILYELLSGVSLASVHPETITSHTILRTPEHLSQEAQHLLRDVS